MMRRRRLAALALAACASSACSVAPPPDLIGTWHGDPPGADPSTPQSVTLSLFGRADATSGHYDVALLVREEDATPLTRQNTWSGRWTRSVTSDNGVLRQVIYLHDMLSDTINQYAVGPGNSLQPTSAYLHRDLTAREIALFTLQPLPGTLSLPR